MSFDFGAELQDLLRCARNVSRPSVDLGQGTRQGHESQRPAQQEPDLLDGRQAHAEVDRRREAEQQCEAGRSEDRARQALLDIIRESPRSCSATCAGNASHFTIRSNTSSLTRTILTDRSCRPATDTFIDCTNLHMVNFKKYTLVAYDLHGDGNWTSGVLGFLHPLCTLIKPVSFSTSTEINLDLSRGSEIIDIDFIRGDYPQFKLCFLNACVPDLVGDDGCVKCSTIGK